MTLPRTLLRLGRNQLNLQSADAQPHVAVLVLTEPREPAALVAEVQAAHTLMPSEATAHMKATFGVPDPDDDDLEAGPARLPLTCPLMHTRLRTPARGAACRHLECFDLEAYVELAHATSHPRWQCPLCTKPARPHQLRVDSWLANVLAVEPPSRLEVEVQPDGQFGPVPERPPTSAGGGGGGSGSAAKRKREAAAEAALELDDGDGAAGVGGASGVSSGGASGGVSGSAGDSGASGGAASTAPPGPAVASPAAAAEPVEIEVEAGDDAEHPIELSDSDEE